MADAHGAREQDLGQARAAEGNDPIERLVWVLRHAKAVAEPPPGGADQDRVLAPRGRRDAAALGERLAAGTLAPAASLPAVALCSTSARTTETAAAALEGIPVVLDRRDRLYYGSPTDIVSELRTLDDGVRSVMVVGHNPAVHDLVVGLVSTGDLAGRARLEGRGFPTCALALCRLPAESWFHLGEGTATLAGFWVPPY